MKILRLLAVAALLGGCNTTPDAELDSARRELLARGGQPDAEPSPWREVGAPAFQRALVVALAAAPGVEESAARVLQARALAGAAAAGLAPGVDLTLATSREAGARVADTPGPRDSFAPRFAARFELDLWGRLRAGARGARADAAAAAADLEVARISLAAESALAWLDLADATERRALLATVRQLATRELATVRRRVELGAADAAEAARTDAELARLATRDADLAIATNEARARLARLLGVAPDAVPVPGAGDAFRVPELPDPGAAALAARPDVRAAEARLAAAGHRAIEARAALLPNVSLLASAWTGPRSVAGVGDARDWAWSVGSELAGPLFDGGRRRANGDAAAAERMASAAAYRNVVVGAAAEAAAALQTAQARALATRDVERRLVAQRRIATVARARYERGAASGFERVREERELLEAMEADIGARADLARARVAVLRSLGVAP